MYYKIKIKNEDQVDFEKLAQHLTGRQVSIMFPPFIQGKKATLHRHRWLGGGADIPFADGVWMPTLKGWHDVEKDDCKFPKAWNATQAGLRLPCTTTNKLEPC